MRLFFSPSILLLIIYSSSKYTRNVEKGTLFVITDLLNPFFFLQLYKFFLKHKFGVSFPSDAEKTFKNINKLIKIVTFVHFCTDSKHNVKYSEGIQNIRNSYPTVGSSWGFSIPFPMMLNEQSMRYTFKTCQFLKCLSRY